jgi:hypothetical protein
MNMKLKALTAAVIMAASISAQAALFDTGLFYSNFNQIASAGALGTQADFGLNLATDANYSATWTAFFANGGTLANAQYAFIAADNLGAGVGGQGFLGSFASPGAAAQTSAPVGSAAGAFNSLLASIDTSAPLQTNLNTSAVLWLVVQFRVFTTQEN